MIVDEHIWLYFNYVSLAATGVCARTLLTYENVSGGVWPNENIGHTKSFHLLTDDYGNKNAVLESVLDANLA